MDFFVQNKRRRPSISRTISFLFVALMLFFATFYLGFVAGKRGDSSFLESTYEFLPDSITKQTSAPSNITGLTDGKSNNVDFSLFWEAWNKLESKSVVAPDPQKMLYGSISGLLSAVDDPYTVFFTPEENKRFRDDIGGEFDGIGIEIVEKNGLPTVVAPLSKTPAESAGIKAGDIIMEVDDVKTETLGLNGTVDKIRGKKGTKVKLKLYREGAKEPITLEVMRDKIVIKSVEWEEKSVSGKKYLHVKVRQFGDDTDVLFEEFANVAIKNKPDGIIVDLRNNPGGYLETAVNLSSYFLDGGVVLLEQNRSGAKKEFKVTKKARLKNFKTAVLVNKGSASASEIFSGALQDRSAGKIIGEKTFGKGSVQELVELSDGSAAKITVAKWLTPNGKTINGEGVTPDIEIADEEGEEGDKQLDRAIDYLEKGK